MGTGTHRWGLARTSVNWCGLVGTGRRGPSPLWFPASFLPPNTGHPQVCRTPPWVPAPPGPSGSPVATSGGRCVVVGTPGSLTRPLALQKQNCHHPGWWFPNFPGDVPPRQFKNGMNANNNLTKFRCAPQASD